MMETFSSAPRSHSGAKLFEINWTNCAVVILLTAAVGGGVIVALAAFQIFGGVNSTGFIMGIIGGGACTLISSGIIISIVVDNIKKQRSDQNVTTDRRQDQNGSLRTRRTQASPSLTPQQFERRLKARTLTTNELKNARLAYTDGDDKHFIHVVAAYGNKQMLETLLERTDNMILDWTDAKDNTPLHIAIEKNNVEIAKELVLRGADTDAINSEGLTPLLSAVKHRCEGRLITAICEKDNEAIRQDTTKKETVMHFAVDTNDLNTDLTCRIIDELVEYGADINAQNKRGETPLIKAAKKTPPQLAVIKHLLENGANPDLVDRDGNKAIIEQ